ncbi:MAG: cell division protein FtsL [Candidatus Cloacimonetes bacterium]|nr:cell division protein FtsL [Candidatus Cloacimonadota bacterium]
MKKLRLTLICCIIAITFFVHFFNQHQILKMEKETKKLSRLWERQKIINQDLKLQYNQLSSRERIEKLALEQLGMIYPKQSTEKLRYVAASRQGFSMIDFFVPSAEALTR